MYLIELCLVITTQHEHEICTPEAPYFLLTNVTSEPTSNQCRRKKIADTKKPR